MGNSSWIDARGFGRGVGVTFLGHIAAALGILVVAPLLAQGLDVDGRGELASVMAPALLIVSVGSLGLPETITYSIATHGSVSRNFLRWASFATIIAGCVGGILFIATSWPREGSAVILASILAIFTLLIALIRGIAMGRQRWALVAVERASGGLLKAVGVAALVILGDLSVFLATAVMLGSVVVSGLVYTSLKKSRRGVVEEAPQSTTSLTSYAFRIWTGSLAGIMLLRLDQTLMIGLTSVQQLGLYAVAVTMAEAPLIVQSAFREVLFSRDSSERSDGRATEASRMALLLCLAIALIMAISMPVWLPVLFGDAFAAASPIVLVLLLAVLVGVPGSVAGSVLSARGNPGVRSAGMGLACGLNLLFLFALVPNQGAIGAAWATLVANAFAANWNIWFTCRRHRLRVRDFYLIRISDLQLTVRVILSWRGRAHDRSFAG